MLKVLVVDRILPLITHTHTHTHTCLGHVWCQLTLSHSDNYIGLKGVARVRCN